MRVKVEPIDSWINVTVSELLGPQARSKAVADFARGALREAQDTNRSALGSEPPYEQFVDSRRGAPLESVNPDRGNIVFEFELVNDVLTWILAELVKRSPRGPAGGAGTYREAHQVFADGIEIALGPDLPRAEEYSFTNTVIYARKLEIGRTKTGRDFLVSVPNRIYDRVSHEAARRFSNIAKIGYTFRALHGGAAVRGRRGRGTLTMRYPTITVRMT